MLPTCSRPVGEGAKRVTTVMGGHISSTEAKASFRNGSPILQHPASAGDLRIGPSRSSCLHDHAVGFGEDFARLERQQLDLAAQTYRGQADVRTVGSRWRPKRGVEQR